MPASYYRRSFFLTERQMIFLQAESARAEVGQNEILRRLLDEYLDLRDHDLMTGDVVDLPRRAREYIDPAIPELPPDPVPDPTVKLRREPGKGIDPEEEEELRKEWEEIEKGA